MTMRSRILLVAGTLAAAAASAHHSFAMFDQEKVVTLKGVVKEVRWTNPHVWFDVVVATDKGEPEQWSIETGATNTLIRHGWKSDSLKGGDTVTVEAHPAKNGAKAGSLVKATLADGQVLTNGAQGASPLS